MSYQYRLLNLASFGLAVCALIVGTAWANDASLNDSFNESFDENFDEGVIEEIIVTARQQAETLQDVPVTVAVFTEQDLDRYNITNLVDAAKLVPNMVIAHGGGGNGSTLRLRGIGSSSISAAFDQSVTLNLDGVIVNRGRFIHNAYMDVGQLEVLKGPQSLYFGKSATAGVVSLTTNDPGSEFEFQISGGIESEYDGAFGELVVSGPITDTLGGRLAVGYTEQAELFRNLSAADPVNAGVNGAQKWYGDESLNSRLTLVWQPTDTFKARLKYSYSEYDNEGAGTAWTEEFCPEGTPQRTVIPAPTLPFAFFQAVDDCRINGNTSKLHLNPGLRAGLPGGYEDGRPGLEQETDLISLQVDWKFTDALTLTSITAWTDLEHGELDDYSYGAGVFGAVQYNLFESFSQEFRLASDFDRSWNFAAGVLWQTAEQEFDAYQHAFNLPIVPQAVGDFLAGLLQDLGALPPGVDTYVEYIDLVAAGRPVVFPIDPSNPLIGPDPFTGYEYDYNKHHFLDTDVFSAFFALHWDLTDVTQLTLGARYTDEEKDGRIEIPYLHGGAGLFGFGAPPLIDGLNFEDDNVSPEVAISHHLTDDASVYLAYKEGFKSGGIDNSALPTAALNPANNGGDFSFLEYASEEVEGWELGLKGLFLDDTLRFNATIYSYEYSNLQVQLFDSNTIQFSTFNASALETQGVEIDLFWHSQIDGLTVRSAWAWNDTSYPEDFFTSLDPDTRENLKGESAFGSADLAGYVGFTYDLPLSDGWRVALSADARYSGEYAWTSTLNPYVQDAYWLFDASVSMYSENGKHQLSFIGRNIGDEIYIVGGGNIPGRCANFFNGPEVCNSTGPNDLDQIATTHLGRTLSVRYRYSLGG